jgi:hypothetical protein
MARNFTEVRIIEFAIATYDLATKEITGEAT